MKNGRSLIRIQGNPLGKRTLRGNPLSTHREHQVEDEENVLDEVHPAGLHAVCFRRIDLLSSNCQSRYLNPISRRHFAGFARPIAGSALRAAVVRSVRERSSWCGSFVRRKGLRSKSSTWRPRRLGRSHWSFEVMHEVSSENAVDRVTSPLLVGDPERRCYVPSMVTMATPARWLGVNPNQPGPFSEEENIGRRTRSAFARS